MDPLFQQAKQMYPNASDDEINAGIQKIRQQQPNASDSDILKAAQQIKAAQDDGSYGKIAATEQVKQKFNLGDYSPEKRQALMDANSQAASPWLAGLAGFGAGLRGGDVGAGFKGAMDASQAKTKGALEAFDAAKKGMKEDFEFDKSQRADQLEQEKNKRELDPNSAESKMAQDLAIAMGMKPEQAKGLTAAKFKDFSPSMQKMYDIKEKSLDRQERAKDRAEAREARLFQQNQSRQDKLEKEAKPSEKQVKEFTEFDDALDSIKSIRSQKSDFDTGPLAGRLNSVAGLIGMDDPKKTAFRSQVQDQLAQYIKSISGGAVSDQERASLIQNIPNMNDNDETFNKKLDALEQRLERNRQNAIGNAQKMGKNVKEFERAPNQQSSGKIKVSNGKETLEIDPSDEADAAKDGYKRI